MRNIAKILLKKKTWTLAAKPFEYSMLISSIIFMFFFSTVCNRCGHWNTIFSIYLSFTQLSCLIFLLFFHLEILFHSFILKKAIAMCETIHCFASNEAQLLFHFYSDKGKALPFLKLIVNLTNFFFSPKFNHEFIRIQIH